MIVTESKSLRSASLGVEREVDIVIEGEFDGEPLCISVEVIEHSRPAGLLWVEQQLEKHRDLPTNRLLLVSKSGFVANALAKIEQQAGRVQALTPEVIEIEGEAIVKRLFVDAISYKASGCKVHVRSRTQDLQVVAGEPLHDVCAADGSLLGSLAYLVQEALDLKAIRVRLGVIAHNHPEKDQLKAFSLGLAIPRLGYHLRQSETGELHLIEELEMWGDFAILQSEVPLTLTKLGGRAYGAAEASIAGRPAVWVGTSDREKQTTRISWQATDKLARSVPSVASPVRSVQFPGLLKLLPPPSTPDLPLSSD
ncbi:hypothetical protein [Acrocarpospora pleiomorpha]|uniref:hypothetical protein n=1 Tax=Acrocarpospora pleiomorpha TaxID=90975 RepID=UPI0031DE52A5